MADDLLMMLAGATLLVALLTLVVASVQMKRAGDQVDRADKQVKKAGEQVGLAQEQLHAARDANTLASQALDEDIRRRNIDALVGLLEALRNFAQVAGHKAANSGANDLAKEQGALLVAIARAAPCLPHDSQRELRAALADGPELFTGQAARDASRLVLGSLAKTTGLDWLKGSGDHAEAVLQYLQPSPPAEDT